MRSVRRGVFETNSSSMHSIAICKDKRGFTDNSIKVDPKTNLVKAEFGDYGWEWVDYTEAYDKLSYILTMAAMIFNNKIYQERIAEPTKEMFFNSEEFKIINNAVKSHCLCDGIDKDDLSQYMEVETSDWNNQKSIEFYCDKGHRDWASIDHQSVCNSLDEFLEIWDLKSVEDFIFDPEVMLKTGNDNEI